ncbi:hypothetical protein L208DRAFT_1411187 [Tricholoma matsutake]|nr:hypothetical protein L208DRAFT_1411187 [Tricholoma matsutake 945]
MPLVFADPPISTSFAHGIAFLVVFSYVGPLYLFKNARLSFSSKPQRVTNGFSREKKSNERWRDDPEVIQARLLAVSIATTFCCAGVFGLLWRLIGHTVENIEPAIEMTILRLGFKIYLDLESLFPHLVTPVLFLGPLYASYLGGYLPFQKYWSFRNSIVSRFFSWQGARNYVFAPITEEIVFRACVLSVYHLSGAPTGRMIFLCPLWFGLAHAHHAWDTFNRYGRTIHAAKTASLMTLFQLSYTTLFGFHCSYLFLRTGSIFPSLTAHIFCNIMGVPEIAQELRRFPKRRNGIWAAYFLGITGFAWALGPWTRTSSGFYWKENLPGKGSY